MAAPKPLAELRDERARARFYAKVADEPDEHGCLLWLASVGTKGYGVFNLPGGDAIVAHRVAYVLAHGADNPADLVIDHLCRVRRCVNPEHLQAVTNRENLTAPGAEHWARERSEQTHCQRGHALEGENLNCYQLTRGRRQCHANSREPHWPALLRPKARQGASTAGRSCGGRRWISFPMRAAWGAGPPVAPRRRSVDTALMSSPPPLIRYEKRLRDGYDASLAELRRAAD